MNVSLLFNFSNILLSGINRNIAVARSSITVTEGEPLRLMCQISSEPAATITWTLNSQPLPQDHK